ncbi:hypothetical protein Ancab_016540 [Ancistrocladus abbreviatus]
MKKPDLILVPSPGAGHRVSAFEFARRFIDRHDDRFTMTILIIRSPSEDPRTIDTKTSSSPSALRYVILPEVELPPAELLKKHPQKYHTDYVDSYKPHVRDVIINSLNSGVPIAGLMVDMFCTSMFDIANELGIPSYVFFTSGAAFLGLLFYLPAHHCKIYESDRNEDLIVPGFKYPIPTTIIPPFLLRETGFITFANHSKRIREAKGIIVNTFMELEPYAVNSLQQDNQNPPIYTVGPVLDLRGDAHGRPSPEQHHRIMTWLDAQPNSSVVFLCFGSLGSMPEAQVREVALGLMHSGLRFLWSVRKPPLADGQPGKPQDYTDQELKEMLPREFVLRLEEGRGMVCGWAPQMEVLAHKAIAGFVSHCGWNSILESVWFGRPIVTWPMYAEQQSNAFQLTREMELAVEMRLAYRPDKGDLVVADELERALKSLMDEDNQARKRVNEMSEMSRRAVMEGGSSFKSLDCLIDDMLKNSERAD